MPGTAALIVLTHEGRIHTILGPEGPVPYLAVEVDSVSGSPYHVQTVIPRREYHLEDGVGAQIVAASEDIAAVRPSLCPAIPRSTTRFCTATKEKVRHKEEMRVTQVVERYECVLRNDEGDTCSVLLDHDIRVKASGKKPKKAGRVRTVEGRKPTRTTQPEPTAPISPREVTSTHPAQLDHREAI